MSGSLTDGWISDQSEVIGGVERYGVGAELALSSAYAAGSAAGVVSGSAATVGVAVHRAKVVAASSADAAAASAADARAASASHADRSASARSAPDGSDDIVVVVVEIDPNAEWRRRHATDAVLAQRHGNDAVNVG